MRDALCFPNGTLLLHPLEWRTLSPHTIEGRRIRGRNAMGSLFEVGFHFIHGGGALMP